jgi:hypothetical protein
MGPNLIDPDSRQAARRASPAPIHLVVDAPRHATRHPSIAHVLGVGGDPAAGSQSGHALSLEPLECPLSAMIINEFCQRMR